jgi:LacI family transcriptional regulator
MRILLQNRFPAHGQVAFFAGLEAGNREYGGDYNFVFMDRSPESVARDPLLLGRIDGCVGSMVSEHWLTPELKRAKRWVNLVEWSDTPGVSSVGFDYREIGRRARGFFASKGVERVLVVASVAQARGADLFQGVCEGGREHSVPGNPVECGPIFERGELREWLRGLAGSAGVIAVSDAMARMVVEEAFRLDLALGSRIRVVGIGDDPEASLLAGTGIASYSLPYFEVGKAVVRLLHDAGGNREPVALRFAPGELRVRASAAGEGESDPVIAKAMAFMRARISGMPDVGMIARSTGVSRRSLELRFRAAGLASPAAVGMAMRVGEARRLLKETDLRIREIADRCGFESQQRFAQAFRRIEGMSASSYRGGVR